MALRNKLICQPSSQVGQVRFFGTKRNPTTFRVASQVGRVRFFGTAKKRNPTTNQ